MNYSLQECLRQNNFIRMWFLQLLQHKTTHMVLSRPPVDVRDAQPAQPVVQHHQMFQAGRSDLQRSAVPDTSLMVWRRAWPRFQCSLRSLTVNVKCDSETDCITPASAQYTAASSSHWPHQWRLPMTPLDPQCPLWFKMKVASLVCIVNFNRLAFPSPVLLPNIHSWSVTEVFVVLVPEEVFLSFYLNCCSQGFEHLVVPPRCTSPEGGSHLQPVKMCPSLAGAEHKGYEGASYWLRFLAKERTSYVALNRKLIQLASIFHRSFQMIFLF